MTKKRNDRKIAGRLSEEKKKPVSETASIWDRNVNSPAGVSRSGACGFGFEAFATYYNKLFSGLTPKEAQHLYKLILYSEDTLWPWSNSLYEYSPYSKPFTPPRNKAEIEDRKLKYVKGLLMDVSLDAVEFCSKNFRLEKFEDADFTNCHSVLFVSYPALSPKDKRCPQLAVARRSDKLPPPVVFHKLDSQNYILLGERYPPKKAKELEKIVGENEEP